MLSCTNRITHVGSLIFLIFETAVKPFRSRGYGEATAHGTANVVGNIPRSLYDLAAEAGLLQAMHGQGLKKIIETISFAVRCLEGVWKRLEFACVAYLEAIPHDDDYAQQVVVRVRSSDAGAVQHDLVAQRNRHEELVVALIDDLSLPAGDRSMRLILMSALSGAQGWYRPLGTQTHSRAVARKFVSFQRKAQDISLVAL